MSFDAPSPVIGRLQGIEEDLGKRMNEYEDAARDRAKYIRDWEKRLATHQAIAKGPNADARKAVAMCAAIEQDDLYENLRDAESRFEALKVVVRVLETRASIGQSILRAQGRA